MLQVRDGVLQALLWQRAQEPFAGSWALPGGYLVPGETLEQSIRRQLAEKVDVRELAHLEQLETRSEPERSPQEWQLATAYLGLVPSDGDPRVPGDTEWFRSTALPAVAFDHESIVLAGRERLRAKLSYTNVGFALAPASSRSPSSGTCTQPRSGTTSRPRTCNASCCGGECSSPPAGSGVRAHGRTPRVALPLPDAELEVTDQFAVLRPPGPARSPSRSFS